MMWKECEKNNWKRRPEMERKGGEENQESFKKGVRRMGKIATNRRNWRLPIQNIVREM